MPYDKWHDNLKTMRNRKWILNKSGGNYSVEMLQMLPLTANEKSDATLVFLLNKERFMNEIRNISSAYNGFAVILDSEGQALFSDKPADVLWNPDYGKLKGQTGLAYDTAGGQKVVVSHIASAISDWKYISVVPYNLYQEKVEYAGTLVTLGLAVSAVIGLMLAYYFSRRNYYPVDELVQIIRKRYGNTNPAKCNEFGLIKEAVNTAIDENERIKRTLDQQNAVLRANFLGKLLKGRIEDAAFIKSAFQIYGMDVHSDTFAVMLFYISDFQALFKNAGIKSYEEQLAFVQFVISNVVLEHVSRCNAGYMLELDDMMTCLVNFRQEDLSAQRKELIEVSKQARDFLLEKYNVRIQAAVSNVHETVLGIPEAYKEALDVMEYETVMETDGVLAYDDVRNPVCDYHYSLESEYQLINCVKAGELEPAEKVLNRVFENALSGSRQSIDVFRCLVFDLASTMLKALNEIDAGQRNALLKSIDFPARLLSCENVSEMRHSIGGILAEICRSVRQSKSSRRHERIEDVARFIDENYTDINFSVSTVADRFHLTPSYLARMFREHTGKGVLDYINNRRIEKAKQLLREKRLNIKEIALKVGYYNINAFIRMFKNNEGITPGIYKDNNS